MIKVKKNKTVEIIIFTEEKNSNKSLQPELFPTHLADSDLSLQNIPFH